MPDVRQRRAYHRASTNAIASRSVIHRVSRRRRSPRLRRHRASASLATGVGTSDRLSSAQRSRRHQRRSSASVSARPARLERRLLCARGLRRDGALPVALRATGSRSCAHRVFAALGALAARLARHGLRSPFRPSRLVRLTVHGRRFASAADRPHDGRIVPRLRHQPPARRSHRPTTARLTPACSGLAALAADARR